MRQPTNYQPFTAAFSLTNSGSHEPSRLPSRSSCDGVVMLPKRKATFNSRSTVLPPTLVLLLLRISAAVKRCSFRQLASPFSTTCTEADERGRLGPYVGLLSLSRLASRFCDGRLLLPYVCVRSTDITHLFQYVLV